jgi:hypothetical protein
MVLFCVVDISMFLAPLAFTQRFLISSLHRTTLPPQKLPLGSSILFLPRLFTICHFEIGRSDFFQKREYGPTPLTGASAVMLCFLTLP